MPTFDDRYDPIYQRGHTGGPPPAAVPDGARPAPPERRPTEQQAGLPAGRPAAYAGGQHDGPGIAEVVPAGAAAGTGEQAAARKRRPNPFLLALWLVGLAAVGFGIFAALVPAGVVNVDEFGPAPSVWLFIVPTLSPGFLAGGMVCVGLALALHALSWQSRR